MLLCIYFSLSVKCTLTLLLQLKQTPTDSSYKPSFKKKDRPRRRNNGTTLRLFSDIQGRPLQLRSQFFFSRGSLGASPQHNNAVFFILVFVFHFFKYFYINFLYPI